MQQSRPALQSYLAERPTFEALFNGGYFTTDVQGVVTASLPLAAHRLGSRCRDTEHVRQALLKAAPSSAHRRWVPCTGRAGGGPGRTVPRCRRAAWPAPWWV
jgi:hypothetical protein